MNNLKELIASQNDYVVSLRRYFHKYPEVSLQEHNTSKRIQEELTNMGIPFRVVGTGIIADIKGTNKGKTIAIRADIDALTVQETNDVEYKSTVDGVMHACGHDGHNATLLATAKVLNQMKDSLKGNVRLLFQQAEENVHGATMLIDAGCLDGVDEIIGMHLWGDVPCGKISVEEGPRMASSDGIFIEFHGKGGHGSAPHQCVDVIPAAVACLNGLQTIVAREVGPTDPVALTIGELRAGSRFNVIADKAELNGSIRTFSVQTREFVKDAVVRYVDNIAKAHRTTATVEFKYCTPAVINYKESSERAEKVIKKHFEEGTLAKFEKITGAEDFSRYLEKVPGVFAFVGAGKSDGSVVYPHHNSKFDIDERSLLVGVEFFVQYTLDYLSSN